MMLEGASHLVNVFTPSYMEYPHSNIIYMGLYVIYIYMIINFLNRLLSGMHIQAIKLSYAWPLAWTAWTIFFDSDCNM